MAARLLVIGMDSAEATLIERYMAEGAMPQPFEAPTTKAMALLNNRCGAIRLNLKGREPHGTVAPGNEETAILEDLRAVLLGLRHPEGGEPIIEHALTAREAFGPDHHPDVPDMIIAFRTDLERIEAADSPQLGRIAVPSFTHLLPRSGDHTDTSRVWVRGPGIPRGERRADANVLDIAPTILNLLGAPIASEIAGRAWFDREIPRRRIASGL
jgi:predicted AlkP superfamily phosphohydrolase/phosphomutase